MVLFSFENIARLEIRFIQCKIKNRTEIFRAKCIIISNEEVQEFVLVLSLEQLCFNLITLQNC